VMAKLRPQHKLRKRGTHRAKVRGQIGIRLKHARLVKIPGWRELADRLDCSESFLSKVENNKGPSIARDAAPHSRALKINSASLFGETIRQGSEQVQLPSQAN
jgi:hypothetical protein